MARFAIVDANNLFYRAVRANNGDVFERSGNGVYVTFKSLAKLVREFEVDHIVMCTEGRSWRYREYPGYKAKRRLDKAKRTAKEVEEDTLIQSTMDEMIEFMQTKTRVTVLRCPVAEGDDLIGRFIQLHTHDEHIILSSDSDFIQLVAENVTVYDAMLDRVITPAGVKNLKGDDLVFRVDNASGKLKVGDTIEEERKAHNREEKAKRKTDPEYVPVPFSFEIEPEWWRKALFVKIIRGDSGDSIFSAYPKVRFNGSGEKVGIREAWEDRATKGYAWNNFMQRSWSLLEGADAQGDPITRDVTVKERFLLNESLIDLTRQPVAVLDEIDACILAEIEKPKATQVGMAFLQFCKRNQQPALIRDVQEHGRYLNAAYPL